MKKDGRRANDNRPGFNQKRPVLEPTSPGENVCGIVYHIFPDGQVPVAWNTDSNSGACCRLCRRPASEMEMTFVR